MCWAGREREDLISVFVTDELDLQGSLIVA
jgi:hypothetical protein